MIRYIDEHRAVFGVEPICDQLPIAPATYYEHKRQEREPQRRAARAPNRLWIADITYVATWCGFVYVAFVIDVFSRYIVGWRASVSLRTDLPLDALEQAIWARLDKLLRSPQQGSVATTP